VLDEQHAHVIAGLPRKLKAGKLFDDIKLFFLNRVQGDRP